MSDKIKNQACNYVNRNPSVNVTSDPCAYFSKLRDFEIKILDTLITFSHKYDIVYPSQERLASVAGVTRVSVHRTLKKFEDDHILYQVRSKRQNTIYLLSKYFQDSSVRSRLRHIFSSFKYLSIQLLLVSSLVISKNVQTENCTLNIQGENKSLYILDTLLTTKRNASSQNKITISAAVENLTCLNLTKVGKIKLSAFPDDAINYTSERMVGRTNIRKPLEWFIATCFDYCRTEKIDPDWSIIYLLSKIHQCSLEGELVMKQKKVYEKAKTVNTHLIFKETQIPVVKKQLSTSDNSSINHKYKPAVRIPSRHYPVFESEVKKVLSLEEDIVNFNGPMYDNLANIFSVKDANKFMTNMCLFKGIIFSAQDEIKCRPLKEDEIVHHGDESFIGKWSENDKRVMPVEIKKFDKSPSNRANNPFMTYISKLREKCNEP